MIYTLTLNPALDIVVTAENFTAGKVNSYRGEQVFAGGKGINVSQMLYNLACPTTAIGMCAGFSGEEILRLLGPVPHNFIRLPGGISRINLKIGAEGRETELNGTGPRIDSDSFARLLDAAEAILPEDTLVLSGSLPPSDCGDLYGEIIKRTRARIVLDTANLLPYLKHRPFLVKPNHLELGAMLGETVDSPQKAVTCGRRLVQEGAQNVLVSMGEQGALLLWGNEEIFMAAARGEVVSPCGAGDSMVAGFLFGLSGMFGQACTPREALRWAVAAGAATAFSAGIAPGKMVEEIYAQIS